MLWGPACLRLPLPKHLWLTNCCFVQRHVAELFAEWNTPRRCHREFLDSVLLAAGRLDRHCSFTGLAATCGNTTSKLTRLLTRQPRRPSEAKRGCLALLELRINLRRRILPRPKSGW
jgi:hypothetical protein